MRFGCFLVLFPLNSCKMRYLFRSSHAKISFVWLFKVLILLYGNKPKLIILILTSKSNALPWYYRNTWKGGKYMMLCSALQVTCKKFVFL